MRWGPDRDRPLRLYAEDEADLAVIAATLQDAVARVGDLVFLPRQRRFACVFTRFCWERAVVGGQGQRVQSGMRFDTVRAVRARGVRQSPPDAVVSLLTMDVERETDGWRIGLILCGGGEIQLHTECIEVHLSDFGQRWYTRHRPRHAPAEIEG